LQVRPLLEVNRLAKFVRLCFTVLCFILVLFSLQWFILLNRTRSLLFFTFEIEGLLIGNYLFVKKDYCLLTHTGRIVNRFLTIGTISKGKSSGRPPVSDKIVKDLKGMVEKTLYISIARLSQQSGVPLSTCHKIIKNRLQLHPYKISVVQELQPADYQSCFNIVITSISEFGVLKTHTNL
jgi:hypothetical protein